MSAVKTQKQNPVTIKKIKRNKNKPLNKNTNMPLRINTPTNNYEMQEFYNDQMYNSPINKTENNSFNKQPMEIPPYMYYPNQMMMQGSNMNPIPIQPMYNTAVDSIENYDLIDNLQPQQPWEMNTPNPNNPMAMNDMEQFNQYPPMPVQFQGYNMPNGMNGMGEIYDPIMNQQFLQNQAMLMSEEAENNSNENNSNEAMGSTQNNKKANLYKTELCRSYEETGQCRYGVKCQFAHSENELRHVDRHPKYKTEMCKTFWEQGTCPYGKRCCFIHTKRDLTKKEKDGEKKFGKKKEKEGVNGGSDDTTTITSNTTTTITSTPSESETLTVADSETNNNRSRSGSESITTSLTEELVSVLESSEDKTTTTTTTTTNPSDDFDKKKILGSSRSSEGALSSAATTTTATTTTTTTLLTSPSSTSTSSSSHPVTTTSLSTPDSAKSALSFAHKPTGTTTASVPIKNPGRSSTMKSNTSTTTSSSLSSSYDPINTMNISRAASYSQSFTNYSSGSNMSMMNNGFRRKMSSPAQQRQPRLSNPPTPVGLNDLSYTTNHSVLGINSISYQPTSPLDSDFFLAANNNNNNANTPKTNESGKNMNGGSMMSTSLPINDYFDEKIMMKFQNLHIQTTPPHTPQQHQTTSQGLMSPLSAPLQQQAQNIFMKQPLSALPSTNTNNTSSPFMKQAISPSPATPSNFLKLSSQPSTPTGNYLPSTPKSTTTLNSFLKHSTSSSSSTNPSSNNTPQPLGIQTSMNNLNSSTTPIHSHPHLHHSIDEVYANDFNHPRINHSPFTEMPQYMLQQMSTSANANVNSLENLKSPHSSFNSSLMYMPQSLSSPSKSNGGIKSRSESFDYGMMNSGMSLLGNASGNPLTPTSIMNKGRSESIDFGQIGMGRDIMGGNCGSMPSINYLQSIKETIQEASSPSSSTSSLLNPTSNLPTTLTTLNDSGYNDNIIGGPRRKSFPETSLMTSRLPTVHEAGREGGLLGSEDDFSKLEDNDSFFNGSLDHRGGMMNKNTLFSPLSPSSHLGTSFDQSYLMMNNFYNKASQNAMNNTNNAKTISSPRVNTSFNSLNSPLNFEKSFGHDKANDLLEEVSHYNPIF